MTIPRDPAAKAGFHPDPASIPDARRFAVEAVGRFDPGLCDAVALVVSELATNAVRHGKTEYAVTVARLATGVRVTVSDGGAGSPLRMEPGPSDLSGRGLQIVGAVADAWGVEPSKSSPGKDVWFEMHSSQGLTHRTY